MIDRYLIYIASVRRYSPRTQQIYRSVLESFAAFVSEGRGGEVVDNQEGRDNSMRKNAQGYIAKALIDSKLDATGENGSKQDLAEEDLHVQQIRAYEVELLNRGESPRTVHLHLSVLSGFCRFLMKEGLLAANPVRLVTRPKLKKRLPEFYREESMKAYLEQTQCLVDEPEVYADPKYYDRKLGRLIINLLYCTGMRRAELIGAKRRDFDPQRRTLRVHGKGDKIREIPLVFSLCQEILLYLQSVDPTGKGDVPLLVTARGGRLYPVLVDRLVKRELGGVDGITGRRSPHVLRHTLATELLDDGADLSAIKEMLGHSSLAATQVYTHNSVEKLKNVYNHAHPRAKNGEKHHGD